MCEQSKGKVSLPVRFQTQNLTVLGEGGASEHIKKKVLDTMSFLPALDENGYYKKKDKVILTVLQREKKRCARLQRRRSKHRRKNKRKIKAPRPLQPKDYRSYINSNRWAKRRIQYQFRNTNVCKICGAKDVHLHHLTYERLGMEEDSDLIPLCAEHHDALHEFVGGSKKNLVMETHAFIEMNRYEEEVVAMMKNL